MGSAIKNFKNAIGITVPRSRFLPIKGCSDLFLLQSDLYSNAHGSMKLNPKRQLASAPLVKLGSYFKKVFFTLDVSS